MSKCGHITDIVGQTPVTYLYEVTAVKQIYLKKSGFGVTFQFKSKKAKTKKSATLQKADVNLGKNCL